jgi:hypothetical protein
MKTWLGVRRVALTPSQNYKESLTTCGYNNEKT